MGDGRIDRDSVRSGGLLRAAGFLSYLLFLLLLLELPAESPRSIVPFGSFVLTNLEATLAAVVLAVLIARSRAGFTGSGGAWAGGGTSLLGERLRDPGSWILCWLAALALSAAAAPDLRGHAAKFTLRCAAIATIFWISRSLHRGPTGGRRLRTTSLFLVSVATLVALIGIIEGLRSQPIEPLLSHFRIVPTTVDGNIRLTATFIHANLAGAFLGMLLPLAVVVAATAPGAWAFVAAAAPALILWALLGTLSRSAIVAGIACAAAAGLVLAAPAQGAGARVRPRPVLVLALLGLICAGRWSLDAPFRARFGGKPVEAAFAAAYEVPPDMTLAPGQVTRVPVTVRNTGSFPWIAQGVVPTNLSYHIVSMKDQSTAIFDGARTPLPGVVPAGRSVDMEAWVQAPAEVGRFLVAWDLVREKVTWFSWKSVRPGLTRLNVVPPDSVSFARRETWRDITTDQLERVAGEFAPLQAYVTAGRRELWGIADRLFRTRPLTGWGADTFRLRYARYLGKADWDPRSHANNAYLEMLATAGILGFAGWVGVLVALACGVARTVSLRRRPAASDARTAALRFGIAAGLAVFALHGLLDSFFGFYGVMGLFWALAGMTDSGRSVGPVDTVRGPRPPW